MIIDFVLVAFWSTLVVCGNVNLPFKRVRQSPQLVRREDGDSVHLGKQTGFYSIDLAIGTPSQKVTVLLDTGSSDLWVTGANNPYCQTSLSSECKEYGTFDYGQSSTFQDRNSALKINYQDGTKVDGRWGVDTLELNNGAIQLQNTMIGVADSSDSVAGVIGLGFPGLETTNNVQANGESYTYANFPMQLKQQGVTDATVFAIALDNSYGGDILFGAVDEGKYIGGLYTLPVVNSRGTATPIRMEVTLQGIGVDSDGGDQETFSSTPMLALVDSGSTMVYLPELIATAIYNKVGARYDGSSEMYTIDCGTNVENDNLIFDFGGFHISTPVSNYIITDQRSSNGQCLFGILSQSGNTVVLGDTFLSSAYVVFDLDHYEISMAQGNSNNGDGNVKDVTSGTIPNARKAPMYSQTWSTNAPVTSGGNIFTLGSTSSKTPDSSSTHETRSSISTESSISPSSSTTGRTTSSSTHSTSTQTLSSHQSSTRVVSSTTSLRVTSSSIRSSISEHKVSSSTRKTSSKRTTASSKHHTSPSVSSRLSTISSKKTTASSVSSIHHPMSSSISTRNHTLSTTTASHQASSGGKNSLSSKVTSIQQRNTSSTRTSALASPTTRSQEGSDVPASSSLLRASTAARTSPEESSTAKPKKNSAASPAVGQSTIAHYRVLFLCIVLAELLPLLV
ncbi:pepsin-like aspartic protease KNAG_0I01200 [Huiozyma naganishii CBS 8797]|uniref:Peptidase A1 domain-containing protein n=1 Tax=Huiozyma naganishii (strain ATCC MYA-139 / BCRC 22969 / CBS 8797 / KCTC 17520 / NBRC 10181 / NCYC 3082 / Yp74L-3) TaxID=1071383 RepID=J7SA50_HUIN7|nr:hypothetical protein KNAG_0I01200 [Kazachstania naganishii CBS 8797]CCK71911.1 hypothetical protein KNAG_0I01200 [Kazachstania naganishii CBS 8797]